MVKIGKCALIALMHKKWTLRVELTKKTSHCKSRDFLRKRRLKTSGLPIRTGMATLNSISLNSTTKKVNYIEYKQKETNLSTKLAGII